MQCWLALYAGEGRTGREVWHCAGVVWVSQRGLESVSNERQMRSYRDRHYESSPY